MLSFPESASLRAQTSMVLAFPHEAIIGFDKVRSGDLDFKELPTSDMTSIMSRLLTATALEIKIAEDEFDEAIFNDIVDDVLTPIP